MWVRALGSRGGVFAVCEWKCSVISFYLHKNTSYRSARAHSYKLPPPLRLSVLNCWCYREQLLLYWAGTAALQCVTMLARTWCWSRSVCLHAPFVSPNIQTPRLQPRRWSFVWKMKSMLLLFIHLYFCCFVRCKHAAPNCAVTVFGCCRSTQSANEWF